ncbi:MAG: undecaprenyl-phosphate glucose phosphotransferase [Eubacteriales bacterium]|nr:undecaprenyl-phosphate glucose phosphotransferase [Eubacteriales bacterium]
MRSEQEQFNKVYILIDIITIILAYILSWYIVIVSRDDINTGVIPNEMYFSALIIFVPLLLIMYAFFNLYKPNRTSQRLFEFYDILKSNLLSLVLINAIFFIGAKNPYIFNFSRWVVFLFIGLNIVFETISRNAIRLVLGKLRKKGINQKHILLVGYSDACFKFIDRAIRNATWGYHIFGIVDDNQKIDTQYRNVKVLGNLNDLNDIISNNDFDEVLITLSLKEYEKLSKVVSICEKTGIHTKFVPDYGTIIPTKPTTDDLDGLPVVNIRAVPLQSLLNRSIKRFIDIIGAIIGIIVFSPFMIIISAIILICRDGSIIFSQERVGLHSKLFTMYKFRSMKEQTVDDEKLHWTTKDDPRVTKIGRIIRRTSLDEVPQFFNVLKGDMSLVGPRPERKQFVDKFKEQIPRYMVKHQVRPGITGYAQVNGYRGDTPIDSRIRYDLYYIENWSVGLDIKILFQTLVVIFTDKNAY